jgi:DNA (cytosine-5)-methyltransferase 1
MLNVNQTDTRCPLIAGMEDVPIDDVLNPRDCVLTNELYPLLSVEDHQRCAYPVSLGKREIEQQVFHGGSLACRHVIICHVCNNGKSYSLIRRHLYAREADTLTAPVLGAGQSRNDSIVLDEEVGAFTVSNGLLGRRSRSGSDSSERASSRCRLLAATKSKSFTLGDVFCGAGGASQGAKQADLTTKWSLDADLNAIQTYRDNHPGVLSFRCNAHDFPPQGFTCEEMQVDVLHISPPCDYFSPNQ